MNFYDFDSSGFLKKIIFFSFVILVCVDTKNSFGDSPAVPKSPCPANIATRLEKVLNQELEKFSIIDCFQSEENIYLVSSWLDELSSKKGNKYYFTFSGNADESFLMVPSFALPLEMIRLLDFIEELPVYKKYEERIKATNAHMSARAYPAYAVVSITRNIYRLPAADDVQLEFVVVNNNILYIYENAFAHMVANEWVTPTEVLDIKALGFTSLKIEY